MNLTKLATVLACGLVVSLAATGCKKKPDYLTGIPPERTPRIPPPEMTQQTARPEPPAPTLPPTPQPVTQPNPETQIPTNSGIAQPNPENFDNYAQDAEIFKAYTVHFAFDSSAVKSDEKPKVTAVADYLKSHPVDAVRIAGHCDERGTAEYNRALGERRALALREELVRLSIDPKRVDTVSFGFDQPVAPGHNEAAWSQNRRGAFILLTPPNAR